MARIRSLKPRFWNSPSTAKADLAPRLLFMALWNWADDAGRGTANLKELEAFAFPNDTITELPRRNRGNSAGSRGNSAAVWRNFAEILLEAAEAYGVTLYKVGERQYYEICSFRLHQSKNYRPDSELPCPDDGVEWDLASEYGLNEPAEDRKQDVSCPSSAGSCGISADSCGTSPLYKDEDEYKDEDVKDLPEPDGSSGRTTDYPAAFEQWWEQYPRKVGKRKAFPAWKSALKRATPQQLIDGAKRYAADPNRRDEYTKHPDGWLGRDGWLDQPEPPRNTNGHHPSEPTAFQRKTAHNAAVFDRLGDPPPIPELPA